MFVAGQFSSITRATQLHLQTRMPDLQTNLSPGERTFLKAVASLIYCNPFASERADLEKELLGADYTPLPLNDLPKQDIPFSKNLSHIQERLESHLNSVLKRLELSRASLSEEHFSVYEQAVWFYVFHKYADRFDDYIRKSHLKNNGRLRAPFLSQLTDELDKYLQPAGVAHPATLSNEHLVAVFFQLRRAYYHIRDGIFGTSTQAGALRARTWESIFTHNFYRYQTRLYERMGDIITLITGPSGTGKELIARAIGLSQFIPYDPANGLFVDDFLQSFYPINLSALSETLIESELFGHRKGAFTGAQNEKKGYFESCGRHGSVFLDEIGETNTSIQVKLLRVLQTRQFQRLGGTESLPFLGKVIAATNRDLEEEIQKGNFREDFFFRICADHLQTTGLREILDSKRDELPLLVAFISNKFLGRGAVSEELTQEAVDWIQLNVPHSYPWPGNFRELEQCVRNIMIHGEYQTKQTLISPRTIHNQRDLPAFAEAMLEGQLSYESLLHHYFQIVVRREGGFAQAARAIGIDQRTVKKYFNLSADSQPAE